MIGFQSSILAGTVLMRDAIQSPNYVAGTSGWTINQDGSVEFNNGVFRGTLVIGTTTVTTVGSSGITVVGPTQTMVIDNTTGFQVTRTVSDGRTAQLDISTTTGDASLSRMLLTPVNPTDLGFTVAAGGLTSFVYNTGTEQLVMQLISPSFTAPAKVPAAIQLLSQTSGSATDDSDIILSSAQTHVYGSMRLGPLQQEIGQGVVAGAHSLTNSAGIAATETVVLTTGSTTFKAGHTYQFTVYGELTASVIGVGNNPTLRVRKTSTAGQQLAQSRTYCPQASTGFPGGFTGTFDVLTADVTAVIVLTLQGSGAFNAVHGGSGTNGRGIYIQDIGSASNPALSNTDIVRLL